MDSYLSTTSKRPRRSGGDGAQLVDRANTLPISAVLEDFFGQNIPPVTEGSYKVDCPFAWEHPDGGVDKNCRVYGNNHIYCFAMHGQLNPVRLIQIKTDSKPIAAAMKLLQHYGLAKPRHWRDRFNDLVVAREQKSNGTGSTIHLVEALQVSLREHPAYADAEYGGTYREALDLELNKLDALMASPDKDESTVRSWYTEAQTALLAVLDKEGAGRG